MRATRDVTAAATVVSVDRPEGLGRGDVLALRRLDERGELLVERLLVLSKKGHEVTVERGADGTAARAWPVDTPIVRLT